LRAAAYSALLARLDAAGTLRQTGGIAGPARERTTMTPPPKSPSLDIDLPLDGGQGTDLPLEAEDLPVDVVVHELNDNIATMNRMAQSLRDAAAGLAAAAPPVDDGVRQRVIDLEQTVARQTDEIASLRAATRRWRLACVALVIVLLAGLLARFAV
jgi:hypothetical protein